MTFFLDFVSGTSEIVQRSIILLLTLHFLKCFCRLMKVNVFLLQIEFFPTCVLLDGNGTCNMHL
jgi:hypothetical protein